MDLSGTWHSYYRYQSSSRDEAEFWGEHLLEATQVGDNLELISVPDAPSEVTMRLKLDPATGTLEGEWQERTEKDGHYQGETYAGTIELTLIHDGTAMTGIWQGMGSNGRINSGSWELSRPGNQPTVDKNRDNL